MYKCLPTLVFASFFAMATHADTTIWVTNDPETQALLNKLPYDEALDCFPITNHGKQDYDKKRYDFSVSFMKSGEIVLYAVPYEFSNNKPIKYRPLKGRLGVTTSLETEQTSNVLFLNAKMEMDFPMVYSAIHFDIFIQENSKTGLFARRFERVDGTYVEKKESHTLSIQCRSGLDINDLK